MANERMWYTLFLGLEKENQVLFLRAMNLCSMLLAKKDKNGLSTAKISNIFSQTLLITEDERNQPVAFDAQRLIIQVCSSFEAILSVRDSFQSYALVTKEW